jgi:hypothetical protein
LWRGAVVVVGRKAQVDRSDSSDNESNDSTLVNYKGPSNDDIAKATTALEHNEAINVNTSLRISNLEKWKLKQEQQTNELSNRIKPQTSQKNIQKNSKGSHLKESMTSPEE